MLQTWSHETHIYTVKNPGVLLHTSKCVIGISYYTPPHSMRVFILTVLSVM